MVGMGVLGHGFLWGPKILDHIDEAGLGSKGTRCFGQSL